ncbi:MAG TPA: hypothetical protein VGM06_16035 [Polyangiaceae bacterium]|jgi:hypothetical protein
MDTVADPIQALLELFTTTLSGVRFADLDAKALAALAAEAQSAAEVVASAEAALTAARDTLKQRQEALLLQAHRAIAYARVFAENDQALAERIDAIALPKAPRRTRAPSEPMAPPPAPQATRPRKHPSKASSAPEPTSERVAAPGE